MVDTSIPTHKVTHVRGWSIDLHVHESVIDNIDNHEEPARRERARTALCTVFRKVARQTDEHAYCPFINWQEIAEVRRLTPHEQAYHLSQRRPMDPDGEGCDECPRCEESYHEQCQSGYCPQAFS